MTRTRRARAVAGLLLLATLATLLSSCAYYNTFFLARRYYFKATLGEPYEVDRQTGAQSANYQKTIDYCKKLLAQYPKSKWVDDAFLMWARALVGRDDPLQTVSMLQDFAGRFPKSDQRDEATFFLALAYRNARRYAQSVDTFDDFLRMAPKHMLVPYALLERSRALMSLKRYGEAADAAGRIIKNYPRHELADKARRQRAEALLQEGDFVAARADFHEIGLRARDDEERFTFLMREADCLESAHAFDEELSLLRSEMGHTPPPPPPTIVPSTVPGGAPQIVPANLSPGQDHYGKLSLRIGTALLLSGRLNDALTEFNHTMNDYPRSALSAEAQYRLGYAYETGAEDFDRALVEYAKVKDQFGLTQFAQEAQQRSDDLGRIMQYRKGQGADSLEKKAEADFLVAERFLFDLGRPDRALEQYAAVAKTFAGSPVAGRALNAQAWVLSRKMNRAAAADSLFWEVVHHYPATEAQVAARDYLEADGQVVPDSLIVLPKPEPVPVDTAHALTPVPGAAPRLGDGVLRGRPHPVVDTLLAPGLGQDRYGMRGMLRDSLGRPLMPVPAGPDSLHSGGAVPPPPTSGPPPAIAPADTTRRRDGR